MYIEHNSDLNRCLFVPAVAFSIKLLDTSAWALGIICVKPAVQVYDALALSIVEARFKALMTARYASARSGAAATSMFQGHMLLRNETYLMPLLNSSYLHQAWRMTYSRS